MHLLSVLRSMCSVRGLRSTSAGVVAVLLFSLASPVAAADWLCNLSEDIVHLVCLADTDLHEEAGASASAEATVVPVVYRGTRYPLDKRRIYIVDLWGPPSEMERLELLAQAAICFRSPACTVTLSPVAWTLAGISRVRTFIRH